MFIGWSDLHAALEQTVDGLGVGQFVIVESRTPGQCDPLPYSQAARTPTGWYCEVVSQFYLPAALWPIDEVALRRHGWVSAPDDNWFCWADRDDVAHRLLSGVHLGRLCSDPHALQWTVGTFPQGPPGGERHLDAVTDGVRLAA